MALTDEEPRAPKLAPSSPPTDGPTDEARMYPSRTFLRGARRKRIEKALQTRRAAERIRTADPFITSEVLYQLSYGGGAAECSHPRVPEPAAVSARRIGDVHPA